MAGGRPTIYTQELADLICDRVATSTFGLKKLCDMYDDLPDRDTIFRWRYKNKEFYDQYTKAKVAQAELLAEEMIDIADDATNDWMVAHSDEDEKIGWKLNGEHVNRSRLRIETRKFHAAKLLPKIYGDKVGEGVSEKSLLEQALDKIPDAK